MAAIHVIHPGFQTTVQDLGRPGYAHFGVSASGTADPIALRLGNLLVGNPEGLAALEMTLVGGTFKFEENAFVALAGSNFEPMLDGRPLPLWTSFEVRAGQQLECKATISGARCYLCFRGGIDVPLVLRSASTHLLTGMGGFEGRALKQGDILSVRNAPHGNFKFRRVDESDISGLYHRESVRITRGPQADYFSQETFALLSSSYRVTEETNRMGLRLQGNELRRIRFGDILTEGVSLGALQIPPSGQPIILFVEHQTTGGYPKIANVIAADLHVVGQLRPRDVIRFASVSFEEARVILFDQERLLTQALQPL